MIISSLVVLGILKLEIIHVFIIFKMVVPPICLERQVFLSVIVVEVAPLKVDQHIRERFSQFTSNVVCFLVKFRIQSPEVVYLLMIPHGIVVASTECSQLNELLCFCDTLISNWNIILIYVKFMWAKAIFFHTIK